MGRCLLSILTIVVNSNRLSASTAIVHVYLVGVYDVRRWNYQILDLSIVVADIARYDGGVFAFKAVYLLPQVYYGFHINFIVRDRLF